MAEFALEAHRGRRNSGELKLPPGSRDVDDCDGIDVQPPQSASSGQDESTSTVKGEEEDEKEDGEDNTPEGADADADADANADEDEDENEDTTTRTATAPARKPFWTFRMRPPDDDEPQDWWFASTAIPLLAATTGPLANVLSIAALVTSWRENYDPAYPGIDDRAIGFPDPHWCIAFNAASLVCGFAGNVFLLFNFERRIRYIVALPATIVLWFFATGILMGITIHMDTYVPPVQPLQTYSQGFWHAVIAAVLYLMSALLLMVNMLGYFLGHYPQQFELTDEQRNLILQTVGMGVGKGWVRG